MLLLRVSAQAERAGIGEIPQRKNPNIKIICADPIGSILSDLYYHGKVIDPPGAYKVEGVGEDMLPENCHLKLYDEEPKNQR